MRPACKEAYPEDDDQNACIVGCDGQMTAARRRREQLNQVSLNNF